MSLFSFLSFIKVDKVVNNCTTYSTYVYLDIINTNDASDLLLFREVEIYLLVISLEDKKIELI